ncbi:TonB-dependent receptor [Kriegella aquimaris]|uniref:TonB-linked outer membrane protein, SusC/RagA family n=1 Tax=Kriegella aquimaris TaxID=192904 RepID=A0A1G9XX33_9FLAO|nr:TonB-dependent receptor [Kriegella aquimaris]SDN00735.1 TonB-linked outer membrane protein, SusC/RagA family [Kriegella aquimaris]
MKKPISIRCTSTYALKWDLKMKLSAFLILMSIFQIHATSYSQKARITLEMNDVNLGDVLDQIESKSEFKFFVDTKKINIKRKVSVNVRKEKISNILNKLFLDTDIIYEVFNKQILLKKKHNKQVSVPEIDSGSESPLTIQQSIIGTIADSKGIPLPGANIIEKGTTNGVTADFDGNFSISVQDENAVLIVSYIGFATKEVSLIGQTSISVILEESTSGLEEVVVVGYGTQKKVNLTGAVSQISSEVLEDRPITNLGQGLQGIIPNLNINLNSGAPGRGASFNIRGTTSINGGEPLILVDGVEMDVNLINPEDIETVSVLKDAASSSIYGARAAYGVILITTKLGKKTDKPTISFSTNVSLNKPTGRPEYMNSMEYANWMNAANTNTNGSNYFDDETMERIEAYYNNPEQNEAVFHHSVDPSNLWRYNGNTNWTEVMLKDHYPINNYNLSISGGGDKVSYYTSLGLLHQKGLMKWFDEDYKRINILQNVKYKINSWLEVGMKATFNIADQNDIPDNKRGSFSNADNLYMAQDSRPIMPVYHPDGNFAGYSGNGYFTNMPAFLSQGGNREYKTNDAWVTGSLRLTPIDGLSINMNYTYNYFNKTNVHDLKEYWDYDAAGPAVLFPHTTPNWVRKDEEGNRYSALNIYSDYEKEFGSHYLKAMIGFNQEEKQFDSFWVRRADLISNDIPYISTASGEWAGGDSGNELAIRGGFFRLNYSFANKYLLEVNGRYDGSSRFPSEDRFRFFPSFSAGWRISNESFWGELKNTVDEFKIRGSYGSLGNQSALDGNYYPYIATYGTGQVNYLLNGEKPVTVYAPGLVSPSLTWETVSQLDFGFDFSMLKNRLSGTFDWYQRDTKDMLTKSKTQPAVLGTGEPQTNAADLSTKGWELFLSWKDQIGEELTYGVNFSFSDYSSEIKKYDNPNGVLADYYVGQKLGEIWGFETEGLFQSDQEAQNYDQSEVVSHAPLAGDLKFKDLDGVPGITRGSQTLSDHGDLKVIGNSTPRYSYGIQLNSQWRNFDFSLFLQGVGKRDFYPGNTFFYAHYSSQWSVPQKFNTDYWTQDNINAYFPRPRLNGSEIGIAQSRYLQNGSYLRGKLVSVGYNFPKAWLEKIFVERLRVYYSGQNLFEFTKVESIFDPESNRVNMYPLNRTHSFGLDISF